MVARKPIDQVGVRRPAGTGGVPQKYTLDDPGRRLILALYDSSSERIDELQRRLGVPRGIVQKWAFELGVTRHMERGWTPEQVEYLRQHFRKDKAVDIAKHLGHTVSSVRYKANRLGLSQTRDDCYTLTALCEGLGRSHKQAKRWADQGWIKGERRANSTSNDPWTFTAKNIHDFIIAHPEEIDLRRVDKFWFIDILAGGRDGIGAFLHDQRRSR